MDAIHMVIKGKVAIGRAHFLQFHTIGFQYGGFTVDASVAGRLYVGIFTPAIDIGIGAGIGCRGTAAVNQPVELIVAYISPDASR